MLSKAIEIPQNKTIFLVIFCANIIVTGFAVSDENPTSCSLQKNGSFLKIPFSMTYRRSLDLGQMIITCLGMILQRFPDNHLVSF